MICPRVRTYSPWKAMAAGRFSSSASVVAVVPVPGGEDGDEVRRSGEEEGADCSTQPASA